MTKPYGDFEDSDHEVREEDDDDPFDSILRSFLLSSVRRRRKITSRSMFG